MIDFEVKNCPVHMIMGSDSDRGVVQESAHVLDKFEIDYQAFILSAHRTHEQLCEYAKIVNMKKLGLVAIAFAGKSAALPGDLAARLSIPVIGVPIQEKFDGQNAAVGSMIDMPPGIGLTMVGINQGKNAALAATRMLAISDPETRERMAIFQKEEMQKVLDRNRELQRLGFRDYMAKNPIVQ